MFGVKYLWLVSITSIGLVACGGGGGDSPTPSPTPTVVPSPTPSPSPAPTVVPSPTPIPASSTLQISNGATTLSSGGVAFIERKDGTELPSLEVLLDGTIPLDVALLGFRAVALLPTLSAGDHFLTVRLQGGDEVLYFRSTVPSVGVPRDFLRATITDLVAVDEGREGLLASLDAALAELSEAEQEALAVRIAGLLDTATSSQAKLLTDECLDALRQHKAQLGVVTGITALLAVSAFGLPATAPEVVLLGVLFVAAVKKFGPRLDEVGDTCFEFSAPFPDALPRARAKSSGHTEDSPIVLVDSEPLLFDLELKPLLPPEVGLVVNPLLEGARSVVARIDGYQSTFFQSEIDDLVAALNVILAFADSAVNIPAELEYSAAARDEDEVSVEIVDQGGGIVAITVVAAGSVAEEGRPILVSASEARGKVRAFQFHALVIDNNSSIEAPRLMLSQGAHIDLHPSAERTSTASPMPRLVPFAHDGLVVVESPEATATVSPDGYTITYRLNPSYIGDTRLVFSVPQDSGGTLTVTLPVTVTEACLETAPGMTTCRLFPEPDREVEASYAFSGASDYREEALLLRAYGDGLHYGPSARREWFGSDRYTAPAICPGSTYVNEERQSVVCPEDATQPAPPVTEGACRSFRVLDRYASRSPGCSEYFSNTPRTVEFEETYQLGDVRFQEQTIASCSPTARATSYRVGDELVSSSSTPNDGDPPIPFPIFCPMNPAFHEVGRLPYPLNGSDLLLFSNPYINHDALMY